MATPSDSIYQTPDAYVATMVDRIRQLGSRITDFSVGSVARTVIEALAAGLSQQSAVADQLREDSYLATATGDALDAKAADQQVTRKAAVAAVGTITISRSAAGPAVTIPAGWSQLTTVPTAGQTPVAFLTTADAVFAALDTTKTVAAVAVIGGLSGNIATATQLLPVNPVAGFQTQGGFAAGSAFTGGVDAESDDALRARVPVTVSGRVKGRKDAFTAAALGVAGVVSVNVLQAGDSRGDATNVAANNAEVYWEGSSGAAPQVASQVTNATQSGQTAVAIAATAERMIASTTVYCAAGTDPVALGAAVSTALQTYVNAIAVGGTVRHSQAIQAIHDVPSVVSATVPMGDLRKATSGAGTAGDVAMLPTRYPTLAAADVTVAVVTLT